MKVLITGIHGFVGSNLVENLAIDNEIYGLDIIFPKKKGIINTYSWEDLRANQVADADAIIHLAGKAHDTKNQAAAESYFKVNRDLTIEIFDYFCAHPTIKKFIFFSTAKAAADKVEGVLTEDVVPSPVGPYGESKIAAENYILSKRSEWEAKGKEVYILRPCMGPYGESKIAAENYILSKRSEWEAKGKEVYILRPCMIHGPGNKGNLNLLYNVVKKGIPWPLGAFENRRTFTSVENVCFAVNGLLTKDVPSGIYNMGDDEALSTNELIEEICKSLGKKAHIWKLPKGMMTCLAEIGGVLHLPLNPERLRKLTENYMSSNAKIKKALVVDKMPVDARAGLRRTLESFK